MQEFCNKSKFMIFHFNDDFLPPNGMQLQSKVEWMLTKNVNENISFELFLTVLEEVASSLAYMKTITRCTQSVPT